MIRREDWPERMDAAISLARRRKFSWGRHDCALFICDVVEAMTGTDMAYGLRGRYSDELGAKAIAGELGGAGLRALARFIASRFGLQEVLPRYARRGDAVLARAAIGGRLAFGVCVGAETLIAGPDGLVAIPLERSVKAWRI